MARFHRITLLFSLSACASGGGDPSEPAEAASPPSTGVSAPVALKKARESARDGDLGTAARWAKRAADADPGSEQAYLLWASCCEQAEDLECAQEAYDAGLEALPSSAELLRESGLFALQTGEIDLAVRRLEQSVSRQETPEAKSDLAFAYLFQERGEEAAELTASVVESAPSCFACWLARAEVLTRLDRPSEAVEAYRRAVGLQPEDADARWGLARALYRDGRAESSLALFEELVGESPEDIRLRVQAAQVASAAGKPGRAAAHLGVVAERRPEDPAVLEALHDAQIAAGDEAAAQKTQAELLELEAAEKGR